MRESATSGSPAMEALVDSLQPGDEILFNDRSEPLRVAEHQNSSAVDVWGPRDGHYYITTSEFPQYPSLYRLDRNASNGATRMGDIDSLQVTTRYEDQHYEVVEPDDLDKGDDVRFGDSTDLYTVLGIEQFGDEEHGEYELNLDSPAGPHSTHSKSKLVYADVVPGDDDRYRTGKTSTTDVMYRRVSH